MAAYPRHSITQTLCVGDLLSWHDRGFSVPTLEDHRLLGKEEYGRWYCTMGRAMLQLASSKLDLAEVATARVNWMLAVS